MKYAILALALALAPGLAGCSKYEVYERNLQYMNAQTLAVEKEIVFKEYDAAQAEFNQAMSSGDTARIEKAKARYKEASTKYKDILWEERRRSWPN